MTGRGVHRVLRVARTIADLADREVIVAGDVSAAAALREDGARQALVEMTAPQVAAAADGMLDERAAWLALASVDGVGELTLPRLVAAFGSAGPPSRLRPACPRRASRPSWRGILERRPRADLVAAIREAAHDPGRVERRVAELGAWSLTPFEASFPERLRSIEPMPPVLFGMGDPLVLSDPPGVAVVGTRRPTPFGRVLAARIATAIVERGASIISGLAFGIDGAAHAATLAAGGRTIAVIGGGLAHAGPRAHRHLLRHILETRRRRGRGASTRQHPDARHVPAAQPHHQRSRHRHHGHRGTRTQRRPHHRAPRPRAGPARLRGAGPSRGCGGGGLPRPAARDAGATHRRAGRAARRISSWTRHVPRRTRSGRRHRACRSTRRLRCGRWPRRSARSPSSCWPAPPRPTASCGVTGLSPAVVAGVADLAPAAWLEPAAGPPASAGRTPSASRPGPLRGLVDSAPGPGVTTP